MLYLEALSRHVEETVRYPTEDGPQLTAIGYALLKASIDNMREHGIDPDEWGLTLS